MFHVDDIDVTCWLSKTILFHSGSNIHILDLKLESRSKAETLRSSSDVGDAMVTYLHWDPASTKLYIGDNVGRVSVLSVSSIKVSTSVLESSLIALSA